MLSDYFKEVDSSSTLEEKISIIKYNSNKARELRSMLRDLKSKVSKAPNIITTNLPHPGVILSNTSIENGNLEIDNLYNSISLLDISSLNEDEIVEKINDILKENKSNLNYISKIKLMLYKEYVLYSNMMFDNMSSEELKDLQDTLRNLIMKINLLDDLLEEDLSDEILDEDNRINNIFFLTTGNGNVIALENLRKYVPKEYYPLFKGLFLGLKNGKFKNLKRITRFGYYEVKDFKIRITFDKLDNGNYIVLDAFMKKYDTSSYYINMLDVRSTQYSLLKDYYLSKIQDESFISEHEEYFKSVINLLDSKIDEEDVSYGKRLV